MSESLCGRSLVSKLFAEVTGKANSVLFVHPQLALCGLVHSVDEQHNVFGYSHVPSLSNIFLLASHAYGRTGRPQAVVMMGEWSPTLVQALVACVHDTIGERTSVLRWADPVADPARLQAVLYLLLLFSTLSGRLSAMALSVNLRHSTHTSATSLSVSPLWLFPRLLTTLRDAGETSYLLHIPIFQHILSAPAGVLEGCIPRQTLAHLAGIHGCTAGAAEAVRAEKWSELVELVTGAVAPAGADFADEALESCVRGFSLILLLLDTRFQEGSERMMPNLQAMLALLGMDEEDPAAVKTLLQALGPHIDQQTGLVSSALPDALYLDALGWAASLLDSAPPTPLALEAAFPFATERYRGSDGGDASQFYTPGAHADRFGVSLVYFPQSGSDLRYREGPAPAKTAAAAAAASTDLPSCLAPHVMLANVAAEHANVWAAKTLLADAASSAKMRDAVAVVDELMQPSAAPAPPPSRRGAGAAAASAAPSTRFAQVLSVHSYLETGAGQGGGGAAVRVDRAAKVLTLRHTHGAVSYPFGDVVERVLRTKGVEGVGGGTALVPGCGGAAGLLESYLVSLAAFLAPQLACDPLFALHVPLYLSTDGGRGRAGGGGGAPVLYERLRRKTEAAIDSSVFLTAAKELYRVAAARGGAPGSDEVEAANENAGAGASVGTPSPPPSRQQRQQQQAQPAAAASSADYHVLQTQLQRMDELDSREPPATVSVHSTPDKKAAPAALPSPSYSRPTSTSARRRARSPAATSAATAASAARRRSSAAAAAAAAARDAGSSKGRTEIACQIAQLQRELERMDTLDNEEPAPTVSHHSTPEKAAERPREGATRAGPPSSSRHSRAASSRRSGSRSASGSGGVAPSGRGEAVNPLQGSLEHMVHMTKAYRLRQQSLQKKSAKHSASSCSASSPQASAASPSPSPAAASSSSTRRSASASSSAGPAAVHLRAATAAPDFNAAAAPFGKHREALAPLAHRNSLRSSLPMSSPMASTAAAASTTPGRSSVGSSSPRRPAAPRSSSRASGSGGFRATPKDAPRREEHGGGGGGAFTEANWHDMLAAF